MTLLRQTSAAATAGAAAAMDATTGGVAAAAAALVNVAERTLSESTAGAPAAAAASGAAGKLLADLGVLEAKWAGEFDKVRHDWQNQRHNLVNSKRIQGHFVLSLLGLVNLAALHAHFRDVALQLLRHASMDEPHSHTCGSTPCPVLRMSGERFPTV